MKASEWNAKHKVGIGVLVKLDDGKIKHTTTCSEAWELGHGQPVVMVEGIRGGYDLARVTPMELQPFFECPDCGKDIADDNTEHATDCSRK